MLNTMMAAAPTLELPSASVEQVSVIRLTSSLLELKTPDLHARIALARSITTVIKKNFNYPKGPEMHVLNMTRANDRLVDRGILDSTFFPVENLEF